MEPLCLMYMIYSTGITAYRSDYITVCGLQQLVSTIIIVSRYRQQTLDYKPRSSEGSSEGSFEAR